MIKRVLSVALIAVMGVACTKSGDDSPVKPTPDNGGKHYVKSIDMYVGDPTVADGLEYIGESIEFKLDDKSRIVNLQGVEYDGDRVVDVYTDIKFEYDNSNGLTITANYDGEVIVAECELNDRGAITSATYPGYEDMEGVMENFEYNTKGELVRYTLVYGGMIIYAYEYEWVDGNIHRITSTDEEYGVEVVCTYTDEPNPYNIDLFYAYAWTMPMLCEVILIHDGLFGNVNRSMLKSYVDNSWGEEISFELLHKFDKNGLVEYSSDGDATIKYRCF